MIDDKINLNLKYKACLCLGYDWERYGKSYDINKILYDQHLSFDGVSALIKTHEEFHAPLTLSVLGKILEEKLLLDLFVKITNKFDDDFVNITMHSYSHLLIKQHAFLGEPSPLGDIDTDLAKNRFLIEKYSNRSPIGFTAPQSFYRGLQDQPELLGVLAKNGIRFIRSDGRGKNESRPAPALDELSLPRTPYSYEKEGYPGLFELPAHGFSDNYLKELSREKPDIPWSVKSELNQHIRYFEKCIDLGIPFLPMFHPWSIATKDPNCMVIRGLLKHALENKIQVLTYRQLYEKITGA